VAPRRAFDHDSGLLPGTLGLQDQYIDAARSDRSRREIDSDRFHRHHAGDRCTDNRRHFWIRLVVSRFQHQGALPSGVGLFGPHRTRRLGNSRAGGVAWIGSHDLDPAKPMASSQTPLEVQVVSLDWKWLFLYPDQKIATVNALTIPVGVPVHFSLTSASVMNAFFIPQLGSMIYTMNGMTTRLNLQADTAGVFHGLSSHFSGDGFSDMHFAVHAVSPADFADWVQATGKAAATLDSRGYTLLAKQSIKVTPASYRLDDSDLFQSVATQKIPAGPGPQGEPSISPSKDADVR
jgi:hypothetical protein